MSLTVLEIVQDALWPIAGVTPPSALSAGGGDTQQEKLSRILYDVSREIRREGYLPQMKRTHTFDLVDGVTSYQLPQDYWSMIEGTKYDTDQNWELDGPISDTDFSYRTYWESGSITTAFRIFGFDTNTASAGGQFKVYPTPAGGESLTFDYYSKHLFLPPNWVANTAYSIGDYVNANGNIYLCDTNGTSSTTAPAAFTDDIVDGTTQWDYVESPYETFQTTSDCSIFDDEVMVLGVRVGYLRGTGKDYTKEYADYKSAIAAAKFRMNGQQRGSFSPRTQGRRWTIGNKRGII